MDPLKENSTTVSTPVVAKPAPPVSDVHAQRPVLPPEITQYFIPIRSSGQSGSKLLYHPMLLGTAEVRYSDSKDVDVTKRVSLLTTIDDGPVDVNWDQALELELPVEDLERDPANDTSFAETPGAASKAKSYDSWRKDFAGWLYRTQRLELMESPSLDVASNPGESERDFRVRLQQLAREKRDESVEKLRQKYAAKISALEEKKRRADQAVEREAEQARSQKLQTAISFGATILSSFMGRKSVGIGTLGKATTAARGVGRSMKEAQDVGRAEASSAAVAEQLTSLDEEFKAETEKLDRTFDVQTEELGKVSLKPTKANISVKLVTLAWAPYLYESGDSRPAWE
jgi:hypothetical protein